MAKKEIAVKRYVVKLSAEERDRLEAMVGAGKNSAQILTRARILLKADVSDAGCRTPFNRVTADCGLSIG